MNLSECPGCGLPREADSAVRVCPLCGWDPSKPAPAARAEAPKPVAAKKPEPTPEPPRGNGKKALLLFVLLGFVALGGFGTVLYFMTKPEEKPVAAVKPNEEVAETKQPDPKPPAKRDDKKPAPPAPPEKKTPEPPPPPEVKRDPLAPEPRPAGARPKEPRGIAHVRLLADDAIQIDGDLDDWNGVAPLTLTAIERGKPTKKVVTAPKVQKAYLAYTAKGLLVAAEVVDTSGALENVAKPEKGQWGFWDNDTLEVFIDTINSRDAKRGASHHHQFFAMPFGSPANDGVGGYESKIIRENWSILPIKAEGPAALRRAGKKTDTGWAIEMLVPNEALRQGALKPNTTIGFEIQLDTGTNVYYFWACDDPATHVSMRPHAWGEAKLSGSDAKLELLDANGKPILVPVPGEPLAVRVTDADLVLDPDPRHKPTATVRNRAGHARVVPLTETAPGSGVYTGTLATRPAPGVRPAHLLELAEDDALTAEYVEPLRGNGDRDRVLRATFGAR